MGNKFVHRLLTGTRTTDTTTDEGKEQVCKKMYKRYRLAFKGIKEISAPELLRIMNTAETDSAASPPILVDCREEKERAISTIKGSISQGEFEERVKSSQISKADMVVCYCTIGYRSGVYTKKVTDQFGLENVHNLEGSLLLWVHAGGELVAAKKEIECNVDMIEDARLSSESVQKLHVYGETWDLAPKGFETVY